MGSRIIAKIQSLPDYKPGMELVVLGRIPSQKFSREDKGHLEILRGYIYHCSIRRYSLTRSAFQSDWSKYSFLLSYMNLELKKSSAVRLEKARAASRDKLPWPDPSSIFIHDGIVIVVLSAPEYE